MSQGATPPRGACVDHLIVLASDLVTGVQWCERVLGTTPAAGGEHPLMGTHNRILNLSSPQHSRAYLEIIAIDPGAARAIPASARRWFDLNDAALQQQVALHGPQLIHWVASVPDAGTGSAALAVLGLDRGAPIAASRPTPSGLLRWRITVREDGQRLLDGCLPTLIEWGAEHPCDSLPDSGVHLNALVLEHSQSATLQAACAALGVAASIAITPACIPRITAHLSTPCGPVELSSL